MGIYYRGFGGVRVTERTLERASWLCLGTGAATSFAHLVIRSETFGNVVYALAVASVALSAGASARSHRLDRRILLGFAVITCSVTSGQVLSRDSLGVTAHFVGEFFFLIVQATLIFGLLVVVQRRIGREPVGVLADASILSLGTWLVLWITVL
jgi:hypothetical protein